MKKFHYQFRVEWGDTDAAGIVYSPNYYKWMDQATHQVFSTIGYPLSSLIRDEHIGIPMIESNCSFNKPLYFEEDVAIISTVLELHDKVFKIKHEFIRGEDEIAHGIELRALASFAGEKPKAVSIPEDMHELLLR
ncbi:acyl-CoA thioesterase [Halalkalibacter alkalisediminis]|uniref:Acyl-CoA thioesterase n=1 Tax=Halalkalibacter alkalisediminis TaxID=935616 RepID=A0ABV6NCI1_9BACI|nr:acyl-CoA thioesterase [Halalkalibacter alkalisediminis]